MLTHYIFVRRDLPVGVLAAMVTHAAGESGALYQDSYDGRFRGATAVVLEAKDEHDLIDIEMYLFSTGLQFVVVHESNGPYRGQFMAIGLVPVERETAAEVLRPFQTLKSCDHTSPALTIHNIESIVEKSQHDNNEVATETSGVAAEMARLGREVLMGRYRDPVKGGS